MKHILEQKVFYADTDTYGVVWHGAYLRWMEMGRVLWCEMMGHNIAELQKQDILLPVVNINLRYKASAKLNDNVVIETYLEKFRGFTATFKQFVKSKETDKVYVVAEVEVVAVNQDSKLYRRMPDVLVKVFERAIECQVSD